MTTASPLLGTKVYCFSTAYDVNGIKSICSTPQLALEKALQYGTKFSELIIIAWTLDTDKREQLKLIGTKFNIYIYKGKEKNKEPFKEGLDRKAALDYIVGLIQQGHGRIDIQSFGMQFIPGTESGDKIVAEATEITVIEPSQEF